jgi:V8-like Glu-specific endopeptidase
VTASEPKPALAPNPAYPYPFPFSRSGIIPFSLYNSWPWSPNGKLFFTQEGVDYVCSGTAITVGDGPPRRALVLTAGHCVNSGGNGTTGGTWNTNTTFCPAWRDGVAPFGCWAWQSLWTTGGWWINSNLRRDVGFVVVANNACGQLGNCVGDTGFAWNQSDQQHYWDLGYPQAAPFTGQRMILCTASTAIRDAGVNALPGPDTMGIGCDMTGGSSGGSWNFSMRMGMAGFANSVNSYKYISPAQPLAIYGPYFDTVIYNLWNNARNSIAP